MHSATVAPLPHNNAEPTKRTDEHRCAQCGERLDRNTARPRSERELCVDCAFDTIACTD
jgi:formylmethanofuran dehydrogenase subunit E